MRSLDHMSTTRATSASETRSHRPRVLLAEDDPALRRFFAEALDAAGFDVEELDNGAAVAARIKEVLLGRAGAIAFDAVVSDLRMPGGSGMSLLRMLRMFDAVTPFVLITAYGDRATHREARVLGATAVLDKPLRPGSIVRELRRAFDSRANDRDDDGDDEGGDEGDDDVNPTNGEV